MSTEPSLAILRQVLALTFSMQGVIVIGVGRGQGLDGFDSAASLVVVDARAECVELMQKQSAAWHNCIAMQAVVAGRAGKAEFHITSNPDESSLIPAEALRPLWRNLTTRSLEDVDSFTLPNLLARLEPALDFRCNWLIIDCMPALPVLEGAGRLIDDFEVLELRCVRDGMIAAEHGASLVSTAQWLEARGFRFVLQREESQPQLCKAVFCRDVRKAGAKVVALENTIAQLQLECGEKALALAAEANAKQNALDQADDLATENAELRKLCHAEAKARHEHVESLNVERDMLVQAMSEAEMLATDRQRQVDTLRAENAELCKAREAEARACHEQVTSLTAERDTLAEATGEAETLVADRQRQIDILQVENAQLRKACEAETKTCQEQVKALTADRDRLLEGKGEAEKLAVQRQSQIDTLQADNVELRKVYEAATKACDEQVKSLTAECDKLKKTLDEGQYRQQLLEEEMSKAEAQLELIKDLYLRQPDL